MKNKVKNMTLFALPLLYIFYIMYIRLILLREPRELLIELTYSQLFLTIISMFFISVRIYTLLRKIEVIGQLQNASKIFIWFTEKQKIIFKNINYVWINFFRLFSTKSIILNFILLRLAKKLKSLCRWLPILFIIILLEVLPKIIILLAFLIDIFWYHQFYYFYKTLWLFLLPLITSTLGAILLQYYEDNYECARSYINITIEVKGMQFRYVYSFVEGFKPPFFIKNIEDFILNQYDPLDDIPYILDYFDVIKKEFKIYWIFLGISFFHFMGWLTILAFGVHF